MAIMAMCEVKGATSAKYDEVIRRLTEIGQRVPDGQLYHVCYGDKQRLQVIDVFDGLQALGQFVSFPPSKTNPIEQSEQHASQVHAGELIAS